MSIWNFYLRSTNADLWLFHFVSN